MPRHNSYAPLTKITVDNPLGLPVAPPKRRHCCRRYALLWIVLVLLIAGAAGGGAYWYFRVRNKDGGSSAAKPPQPAALPPAALLGDGGTEQVSSLEPDAPVVAAQPLSARTPDMSRPHPSHDSVQVVSQPHTHTGVPPVSGAAGAAADSPLATPNVHSRGEDWGGLPDSTRTRLGVSTPGYPALVGPGQMSTTVYPSSAGAQRLTTPTGVVYHASVHGGRDAAATAVGSVESQGTPMYNEVHG